MARKQLEAALVLCVLSLSAANLTRQHVSQDLNYLERGPPKYLNSGPLSSVPPWHDISSYVALGDEKGSALAYGDYTGDRFSDLVMTNSRDLTRSIFISVWRPREYKFRPAVKTWGSDKYVTLFSLDHMPKLPLGAYIASAVSGDIDADGHLDVILSIYATESVYVGLVLYGNGMGGLCPGPRLEDLGPDFLLMDGDNDLVVDILFSTRKGSLAFYRNSPPGHFQRIAWQPFSSKAYSTAPVDQINSNVTEASMYEECYQTRLQATNAYVDMNGDCLPDLVLTTANCGILVWLNAEVSPRSGQSNNVTHPAGRTSSSSQAFWDLSIFTHKNRFVPVSRRVWDRENGDGAVVFADFNADGSNDIAVANHRHALIRVSLNLQPKREYGELCTPSTAWTLDPYVAIHGLRLSTTLLGASRIPGAMRAGDFNYDGLVDLVVISADTGTVQLYEATRSATHSSDKRGVLEDQLEEPSLPEIQINADVERVRREGRIFYEQVEEGGVLYSLEDPIAAAFLDPEESGRQDLLIVQTHGTRLLRNSYNELDDSEFFKATSSNAVVLGSNWHRVGSRSKAVAPMPGGTIKISYGGVNGREQHVCSQCPQTGLLSLQSCSCMFGIRRIANYIEEMSIGGGGLTNSWSALMPNAIAMLWPADERATHWRVAYFTTRRGRQMAGVVMVLGVTLIVLCVAIVSLQIAERRESKTCDEPWKH